jgi:hypothetical protein
MIVNRAKKHFMENIANLRFICIIGKTDYPLEQKKEETRYHTNCLHFSMSALCSFCEFQYKLYQEKRIK